MKQLCFAFESSNLKLFRENVFLQTKHKTALFFDTVYHLSYDLEKKTFNIDISWKYLILMVMK